MVSRWCCFFFHGGFFLPDVPRFAPLNFGWNLWWLNLWRNLHLELPHLTKQFGSHPMCYVCLPIFVGPSENIAKEYAYNMHTLPSQKPKNSSAPPSPKKWCEFVFMNLSNPRSIQSPEKMVSWNPKISLLAFSEVMKDVPIISWEYDDWCLGRVFPYVLQTRPQNNQWLLPVAQVETVDRCQLQGLQHNPGAKVQHFERPNRHNAISYGPALITSFCLCGQIWSCVFCFIYEKSEVWNLSLLSSAIFGQMIIHHL